MSDHDRMNLQFLLYASDEELAKWYAVTTQDDLDYAHALLEVAKAEVIDSAVDRMSDLKDARRILIKIIDKSK